MRKMVERGSLSSRVQYEKLRDNVWDDVLALDRQMYAIHGRDIQEIAMIKGRELGLFDFKVNKKTYLIIM